MRYQENARIERYGNDKGDVWGQVKLQHVADPKSVVVTLCEQRLYPEKFNILGEPIFSNIVCDLFDWKQQDLRRKYGKDYRLTVQVTYATAEISIEESKINSKAGIASSVKDLQSFNELVNNRIIYNALTKDNWKLSTLNEYVIFGKYWLDRSAQVWTFENEKSMEFPMVCTISEFYEIRKKSEGENSLVMWYVGEIPEVGESCPWCTKHFTIEDLKKSSFGKIKGKIAHYECQKQYEYEWEIDSIIHRIMELVYDELTFEILPNGYSGDAYYAHRPWFLCHTPDGDIKIGWRKRVISIEWQENFKQFDMSIFDSENVTKWNSGIHAWGREKAYEYLKKVKDVVNKA